MALAEELDLKGLAVKDTEEQSEECAFESPTNEQNMYPHFQKKAYVRKVKTPKVAAHTQFGEEAYFGKQAICEKTYCNINTVEELDKKVKSMMIRSLNMCKNGKQKAYICQICGKEGPGKDIRDHIEANHLEGVTLPCTSCDKTFRSRNSLSHHKKVYHS